jgi:preprotein translocase subunit SecA
MLSSLLTKVFGTANERTLKVLWPIVYKVRDLEASMEALSDTQLAAMTNTFREQIARGRSLDDILPEAYAVVREVARRTVNMRPFDVQILGATVLHQGKIAEMRTGEGKTLTSSLALYLNALPGKGAHAVTVNDYLAKRDSQWNAPIYNFLGLSVAALTHDLPDSQKKGAYNSDILYATNNELGFDYLRDNMKFRYEDYVQRELNYAIIDECDSILIDEARTPLIISGAAEKSSELYKVADSVVRVLQRGVDYEVDEKARSVQLTESGHDKVEQKLQLQNLYAIENINMLHHMQQALKAHALFKKDVEYVVRDGQILIVDEFTGRILSGRRYSDGLHQAIEAKEHVKIEQESQTLASITLQNFFRMYNKLAGMTGTAATEAEEFLKIYKLDVVEIPTNVQIARQDKDDLIFLTENAKFNAIALEVQERHKKGQPVLIGTVAIERSEKLSARLTQAGIPHEVLNAKNHAREAEIIQFAGQPGKVTIATNMAGRGTDIKLSPESKAAGGLYVLGTERHESRRIDNQLRGRSGRQGDPGESRFYISLEDDLIRIFAGDSMKRYMQAAGMKEDENIESPAVSKLIARSQEKVEKHNFDIRKHLLEYDDVLNQHRTVIYAMRQDVLKNDVQMYAVVRDFLNQSVQDIVKYHVPENSLSAQAAEEILEFVARLANSTVEKIKEAGVNVHHLETFITDLQNFLLLNYDLLRNQAEEGLLTNAEKWLILETIDQAWKQHMVNIDHLKEGIGLRGVGQKNPLIEYKKEAFIMFTDMMRSITTDVVGHIFHLDPTRFNSAALQARREQEMQNMQFSGASEDEAGGAVIKNKK